MKSVPNCRPNFQLKTKLIFNIRITSFITANAHVKISNRRIVERIQDHNNRDKNSHLLKHAREKGHTHALENDFKILGNSYQSNIKHKISESLYIRQLKPTLNAREKSISLHLFN